MQDLGQWHHMNIRLKTGEKLGFLRAGSLIDVGCGDGRYLAYFKKHGIPFCVGIDISRETIAIAKIKLTAHDYVDLLVASAENIPFKDNCFDLVFSADVVEHLLNPSKGIKEMVRVSRDRILIATPNKLCPIDMSKVARVLTHHCPPPIEKYLTRFQLRRMLRNAGLKPIDIQISESSFFPLGWLLVHVKLWIPIKLLKMLLVIEDSLEKTPLRYIAGVIVAHCRKSS